MIDITKSIQEQLLLQLKNLRLLQEKRKKELQESISSLEASNAGFLSFSDLDVQKAHLVEKHERLLAQYDALLQQKNEKEAREKAEEEARRKALEASNQKWLEQCEEKLSLLENLSFVQVIEDMDKWIREDKLLQERFGGGSLDEIPLMKLQANEAWYIHCVQTINTEVADKIAIYVQKYAEKETIRKNKQAADMEKENVLEKLQNAKKTLLEKGVTQEIIEHFTKMNPAEEKYYQVQVLKRISDDMSIEQHWNNYNDPLAELEESQ